MFNKFFVLVGVGAVLSLGLTGCSTMPTTNEICLIENQRVRECLDFCVQGGFQGGSQSRLPFVYRGLKINDQRLRGTLSRRHKCAKRGECDAPSGGFHHTLHHSIAGSFAYRKSWRDSQERRSPRHP